MDERFTKIPNELFNSGLAPLEKLVWMYLKYRIGQNSHCWPSAPIIAQDLGLHRNTILRIVAQMETKGLVSVIRERGQSNRYVLITSTTEQPVAENNQLQRSATPAPEKCYPAPQNNGVAPEKCSNKTQEQDTRIRLKNKIQRPPKHEQLKTIQESFPEFQEQFPYRDVPRMYEQWLDWMAEKGKRPSNYKASFRNFLRLKDWEKNLKTEIENAARGSPSHGRKTMSQWIKEHEQ